jgi:hypothetical protein
LFGIENKKIKWKMEYEDTIYKIYDWDKNLAGYFFPKYDLVEPSKDSSSEEEDIIERLNKSHKKVLGGDLMIPMIKLNLFDKEEEEVIDLDYTIRALGENLQRTRVWKQWLQQNYKHYEIIGNAVYTAREDRNMLSIVLRMKSTITLGEKEMSMALTPLLDNLHEDGLL